MHARPEVPLRRHSALKSAWVIARREMNDSLRDWRILTPIIILTLIFPFLMDFTSRWATNWVAQFSNPILMERLNPFLLMIVGFFPISFSLIIALESFVGEKESRFCPCPLLIWSCTWAKCSPRCCCRWGRPTWGLPCFC